MKNEWARTDKGKVAPVGHKRRLQGRGHEYVKGKWVEVPSNVALLCVNRKVSIKAASVLYSRTKFQFENVNTMRRFLNSIGDNNQYLRVVRLPSRAWDWRGRYNEAGEAFEALAAANNIQTLKVAHLDGCPIIRDWFHNLSPGIPTIVRIREPLLDSLQIAYKNNDLDASILDVIKIGDAHCQGTRSNCYCYCTAEQAIEANVALQRTSRQRIAEQHGLESEL